MKIIHKYIFKKLWSPFLFGLLGTTLIISLDPMQKAIDYSVKNKVAPEIALEWFLCSIPKDMLFIFPTSCLLAGLLVFAQMSKDSELVAMKAGTISFLSTLKPVLLFSLFIFFGVYYIQDQIIPPALKRRTELFRKYIRQFKTPKYRKNVVMRIAGDRLLCIGRIDLKNNTLFQLVIQEPDGQVITSSKATIKSGGNWTLENVWRSKVFLKDLEREGNMNEHHKALVYDLTLSAEDLLKYEMKKPQELSYKEILEQIQYHEQKGVIPTRPLWVDFYSKTAFPFATIIFCFLGACLGVSSHRGGGFLGFGISLLLSFLYFVIMGFSMPLGKSGVLSPFLAGWMQNLVFLAVTIIIIFKKQSS
ncbi:MAG: hypothetical protein COB02_16060 [Candidatus Cloacimonadota bacterium]|nr:MAG: hypothetical protein COB02_16060 [Candidatus Cloacimonadota bacterium]